MNSTSKRLSSRVSTIFKGRYGDNVPVFGMQNIIKTYSMSFDNSLPAELCIFTIFLKKENSNWVPLYIVENNNDDS